MQTSDQDLIHQCMLGSMTAFEQLVKNYQQYAYRIAYGILDNPQDAEDIVQEAFVIVFRQIKTLRSETAFPKWLATVVTNLSLKQVKKNPAPTKTIPLEDFTEPVKGAAETLDAYKLADLRNDLHQALVRLPVEYRAVLILRELQGYAYGEIAEMLQLPLGTVKSRIHQARTSLADILQPPIKKGEE